MKPRKNRTTPQIIAGIVALAIAYFVPEITTGDQVLDALISFTAFAPLVMYVSAAVNTFMQYQDLKAYTVTGIVAIMLGYVGYFADMGFLAQTSSLWWHPIITGTGIFAAAVLGFSHEHVKAVLEFIFDYSWKKANHVQTRLNY